MDRYDEEAQGVIAEIMSKRRTDKDRLEWLFKMENIRFKNSWENWSRGRRDKIHQVVVCGKEDDLVMVKNDTTYRKAIDAAMTAEAKSKGGDEWGRPVAKLGVRRPPTRR